MSADPGTARLSGDGRYRYDLTRTWDPLTGPAGRLMYVMLNPSTADSTKDDQTVRRCSYFAKREGYGGLVVVNLYAWRCTHPADLLQVGSPAATGPGNQAAIEGWLSSGEVGAVICAWGQHKLGRALARLDIEALVHEAGLRSWCLGRTAGGYPRHPSRLPNAAQLEPFGPYE